MKTIATINFKGGVAKTATAVNLGYELASRYGKRVLIIDTDQNRGATKLLLPPGRAGSTITDLLTGLCENPYDLIYKTGYKGLDMLPGDEEIATYGTDAFANKNCRMGAILDLCLALEEDDSYDYVIIDSAPGMAAPMVCTVTAADEIIIPMTLDVPGESGMIDLLAQMDGVRKIRPDVRIAGALVAMLQKDDETAADLDRLRAESPVHVFKTPIRWSPKVRICSKMVRPILDASPRCAASVDYRAWVKELLERMGA